MGDGGAGGNLRLDGGFVQQHDGNVVLDGIDPAALLALQTLWVLTILERLLTGRTHQHFQQVFGDHEGNCTTGGKQIFTASMKQGPRTARGILGKRSTWWLRDMSDFGCFGESVGKILAKMTRRLQKYRTVRSRHHWRTVGDINGRNQAIALKITGHATYFDKAEAARADRFALVLS